MPKLFRFGSPGCCTCGCVLGWTTFDEQNADHDEVGNGWNQSGSPGDSWYVVSAGTPGYLESTMQDTTSVLRTCIWNPYSLNGYPKDPYHVIRVPFEMGYGLTADDGRTICDLRFFVNYKDEDNYIEVQVKGILDGPPLAVQYTCEVTVRKYASGSPTTIFTNTDTGLLDLGAGFINICVASNYVSGSIIWGIQDPFEFAGVTTAHSDGYYAGVGVATGQGTFPSFGMYRNRLYYDGCWDCLICNSCANDLTVDLNSTALGNDDCSYCSVLENYFSLAKNDVEYDDYKRDCRWTYSDGLEDPPGTPQYAFTISARLYETPWGGATTAPVEPYASTIERYIILTVALEIYDCAGESYSLEATYESERWLDADYVCTHFPMTLTLVSEVIPAGSCTGHFATSITLDA